jgi:hypothetical protein
MTFATSKKLFNHSTMHDEPVQCPHCQAVIKQKRALKRHIKDYCKKAPLTEKDSREEFKTPSLPASSNLNFEAVACVSLLPTPSLYSIHFSHSNTSVLPSDMMELESSDDDAVQLAPIMVEPEAESDGEIPQPGPGVICLPVATPVHTAGITRPINNPVTTTTVVQLLDNLKTVNADWRTTTGQS